MGSPLSQPPVPSKRSPTDPPLGTLYGLGVGPGDPELITVKALSCLRSVPVVAFPAGLRGRPGVAERIIAPWLSPAQTQLPLHFPYVQDLEQLSAAWQQAAEEVWPYLQKGDVAFACEGDISFYSTFTYLAQSLQQQHPAARVRAIAGISSPMAAAAALGIPLTYQHQRLTVLPALYDAQQLETALDSAEVVVLMKVSSVYAQVWEILARRQLLASSHVVQNATKTDQVIYTDLQRHPNLELPYFSIMIVRNE
ncbi:precorrin-2 C(20)-methyltransferase [cf. Phormidesmis sp. LEGE 11477]|uniref:precorrin-2 C(20)-methyltransferase n=1 Tax=cf. Phormidesmis sp. LEGE 11477 TaxID=1828680 RepID=UPI00188022EB|nr:precorrin-2 C(20)-methyltransferase [cf. Phormidesmis sp. LEGE 11477]MBE9061790.1 precorrin-2 C(20)-methyltransferase [cf. Phormidesmis sp. LEGE 11477]